MKCSIDRLGSEQSEANYFIKLKARKIEAQDSFTQAYLSQLQLSSHKVIVIGHDHEGFLASNLLLSSSYFISRRPKGSISL